VKKIIIYCDGAARGNPGPAGAGALILGDDGSVIFELSKYLGETTNNQAEYQALIMALEEARKQGVDDVQIYSDSELMVRQIKGEYRVKNGGLKELFKLTLRKLQTFKKYSIDYLPREKNSIADALANRAIDNNAI
jgi:ribonuclease HI